MEAPIAAAENTSPVTETEAATNFMPNEGNLSPTPLRQVSPPAQRRGASENALRFNGTPLPSAAAKSQIENPESSIENPSPAAAKSQIENREHEVLRSKSSITYPQNIPSQEIKPLVPALSLPEVSPIRQRHKSRFDLLAGGTISTAFGKPGYFAGLSYTPPSRGKISFPVSLRYRFDAIEITVIDGSRLSPPTTVSEQGDFDPDEAARGLLSDLAIGNFNELRSSGLELRAGMAWRAAPRLRLSGHGGLQYLFSARGPSLSSDENSFSDLSGTARYVNLNVGGLSFANFDLVASPTPGNAQNSSPNGVNRWALRAGLNANYQLTGRLGVFAGGQYLLTPIYQDQAAKLRKGQLEAGLTWRIW